MILISMIPQIYLASMYASFKKKAKYDYIYATNNYMNKILLYFISLLSHLQTFICVKVLFCFCFFLKVIGLSKIIFSLKLNQMTEQYTSVCLCWSFSYCFSYKKTCLTGIKCIICIDICKTNKSGSSLSMEFSGGKINHVNVFSISMFSKTRRLILSGQKFRFSNVISLIKLRYIYLPYFQYLLKISGDSSSLREASGKSGRHAFICTE